MKRIRKETHGICHATGSRLKEGALDRAHTQRRACAFVALQRRPESLEACVCPAEPRSLRPSESLIFKIGILEIACTFAYLIPRTAILGAILMTAYLGGATATNVRVGDPSSIMTVLLGVLVWVGLYLREQRLRALVPLRS
jgi:DoxX-like family